MNAIVFDSKNLSAEISIDDLAKTIELGDNRGNLPIQCPVQPGVLMQDICRMIKRHTSLDPILKPIIIREPYCQTNRKKAKEGLPLDFEDYMIKRLVTTIEIPKLAFADTDNAMAPGIALTYCYTDDKKGIQIAFGENVQVCDNLNAYGRFHFSTYGSSKVKFEEGLQLLDHWIQNLDIVHRAYVNAAGELMNIKVPKERFHQVIGSLFERSVQSNTGSKINAPLSITDCTAMVRAGGEALRKKDSFTAWEIMNWGTDILKPHSSEMSQLISNTIAFNDFILDEFNVKLDVDLLSK